MATGTKKEREFFLSFIKSFLRNRILRRKGYRRWEIAPTLIRHNPWTTLEIVLIGLTLSAITIFTIALALLNEMSGILTNRPVDVYLFIVVVSVLVGSAILFYPLLFLHYRCKIYLEEETERLSAKYREGLQEFQRQKGRKQIPDRELVEQMSQEYPEYQDFAYLHSSFLDYEAGRYDNIDQAIQSNLQYYESIKKDIMREMIYATAMENLEFSAYDLSSYLLPVSYCMLTVAFGFIILSLIPLLGTGKVQIGDTSINLVWAGGGFIGAYIYSFFPFFQRCTRGDMPPRAFLLYALKIFLGPIAVAAFGNIFFSTIPSSGLQFAGAVALGSVPFWVLAYARREYLKGRTAEDDVGSHDVFTVPGITDDYAERLHEEGIMNVQNLAFVDPENLSKRTMLNKDMLFDWKSRAILMLLTGNILTKNMKQ